MQLLDDVGHGFVVAQRVEVVFVQSATAVGIDGIQRGTFAEVYFDGAYTHFNQIAELLLIPLYGFGVGEVQHHVLVRELSLAVAYVQTAFHQLGEELVFRSEVGELPEAGAEAL